MIYVHVLLELPICDQFYLQNQQKVMRNEFQSTREFLHETEWILHNCIIYNGGKKREEQTAGSDSLVENNK